MCLCDLSLFTDNLQTQKTSARGNPPSYIHRYFWQASFRGYWSHSTNFHRSLPTVGRKNICSPDLVHCPRRPQGLIPPFKQKSSQELMTRLSWNFAREAVQIITFESRHVFYRIRLCGNLHVKSFAFMNDPFLEPLIELEPWCPLGTQFKTKISEPMVRWVWTWWVGCVRKASSLFYTFVTISCKLHPSYWASRETILFYSPVILCSIFNTIKLNNEKPETEHQSNAVT